MSTDIKLDEIAVENFRKYLRISSVQPDVNYGKNSSFFSFFVVFNLFFSIITFFSTDHCVEFMKEQASTLNLPIKIIEISPKKPIIIITWEGTEPEKPAILLNGHMDVVPVFSVKKI